MDKFQSVKLQEVFDSFNLSSMTDRTTGKTQHNFTNNMTGQKLYSVSLGFG